MDGETVIGIGLSVFGVGLPLTVAVAQYFRSRNNKILMQLPGYAPLCREHDKKFYDLQLQIGSLSDNVSFIRESVKRIEDEVEKIQDKLA